MLAHDLAALYGIETKNLNKALKRNQNRFPEDFAFQLSDSEWKNLRFQIGTSSYGGRRYRPYAFTEHGVVMLANVIRSEHAIKMSVEVVRAFIRLRQTLATQSQISKELSELKAFMLKHANANDREFLRLWQAIEKLSSPPNSRRIGFDLN